MSRDTHDFVSRLDLLIRLPHYMGTGFGVVDTTPLWGLHDSKFHSRSARTKVVLLRGRWSMSRLRLLAKCVRHGAVNRLAFRSGRL